MGDCLFKKSTLRLYAPPEVPELDSLAMCRQIGLEGVDLLEKRLALLNQLSGALILTSTNVEFLNVPSNVLDTVLGCERRRHRY